MRYDTSWKCAHPCVLTVPLYGRVVDLGVGVAYEFVSPVGLEDVAEVEHHTAVRGIIVCVAVESHTVGARQLDVDAKVVEAHGIVAGVAFSVSFLNVATGFMESAPE